ncbi:Mobile element protein [Levilactobacillus brevis]|nr:Mobile element protein [Levilactobacillus brevis]
MPAYDGLPQTLCIDEFRSTSNQMSFITIDGQKHDIITILPGRQTNEIKQFFLNHYSLKNREQVTQVSNGSQCTIPNFYSLSIS